MNLEDQLSRDLKTLGDSQPVPTSTGLDGLTDKVESRRRRRHVGTGAIGALALVAAGLWGASALDDDVEEIATTDRTTAVADVFQSEDVAGATADEPVADTEPAADAVQETTDPPTSTSETIDAATVDAETIDAGTIDALVRDGSSIVAAGNDGQSVIVERSVDGESWERLATTGLPNSGSVLNLAAVSDGYLLFINSGGALVAHWSADLVTWTSPSVPALEPVPDNAERHIGITQILESPAGVLVAGWYNDFLIGDEVPASSSFGTPMVPNQVALIAPVTGADFELSDFPPIVPHAIVVEGGEFLVSGSDPADMISGTPHSLKAFTSADGVTWAKTDRAPTRPPELSVPATSPDGSILRISPGSATQCCAIERSLDGGETWSYTATPAAFNLDSSRANLHLIEAGPGGIVVAGTAWTEGRTVLFHSVDGVDWTPLPALVGMIGSLAVADDEAVVLLGRQDGTHDRVRIPLPG